MRTTVQKTVGEIAAEVPASLRVFEKYGIDYCCGGKFTLSEACLARGLNPDQVLEEFETGNAQPSRTDWQRASLNQIIDHILASHHAFLKSELPRLERMLGKVQAAHSSRHGDVLLPLGNIFEGLRDELDAHLMKEEMVLFPIIRNLESAHEAGLPNPPAHCGSVSNPIRVMEHEHDSAGSALAHMRQLTGNYAVPADGCTTYRALYEGIQDLERDLHQHIHLENNILFPRAARLEAGL